MNRLCLAMIGVCVALLVFLGAAPTPPATAPASAAAPIPTLFIAGDSTSASNTPTAMGWGIHFQDYFDPAKLKVVNGGKSGLSSRTFITGGSWEAIISKVRAHDFVIIQFGHNDNGPVDSFRFRGTMPSLGEETQEARNAQGQPETVHTFGWYMRKMIRDVVEKKAVPIVVSMTVRDEWANGKVERGFGDYAKLAGELAKAQGVRYIDLNNMAADRYDQMGQAAVKAFFPRDNTHNSPDGAKLNADFIVAGLKALHDDTILNALSATGRALEPGPAKYALAAQ
jgi:lysophospholipase L1-like esterase